MHFNVDSFLTIIKTSFRFLDEGKCNESFALGCIHTAYNLYQREREEWLAKKREEVNNEKTQTPSF